MLHNTTSASNRLFAYITHPLTARFPENNPSTIVLSPQEPWENFNFTLSNKDDRLVISDHLSHFRSLYVDGGKGDNALQLQYSFDPDHLRVHLTNFKNLIGSPNAQHIRVPQYTKFVDGGGGKDIITLLNRHGTSSPEPISIALNGGKTVHTHHRETILIPSKDAQGTSTLVLEDTPRQHRILFDTLDDLHSID